MRKRMSAYIKIIKLWGRNITAKKKPITSSMVIFLLSCPISFSALFIMGTKIRLIISTNTIRIRLPSALSGGMSKKYKRAVIIEVMVPDKIGKYPTKPNETRRFLKNFSILNIVHPSLFFQYQRRGKQVCFQDAHTHGQDDTRGIFLFLLLMPVQR